MLTGPHAGQRIVSAGAKPADAKMGVILLHGRGGSPEDLLGLVDLFDAHDIAYLAPQAAGHSWWPNSFLAPLSANEPGLSSGLEVVEGLVKQLNAEGLSDDHIIVAGFSQGGCLALEYVARAGRNLRAGLGFSAGLIGNSETNEAPRLDLYNYEPKAFDYKGNLTGVDVFIGCNERDPHIPLARVQESATVFEELGASVTERIYPGSGHGITKDEVEYFASLLA